MPVRTSAVVAGGVALLTVVGVTTIFGETLLAMFASPKSELATGVQPGNVSPASPAGSAAPPVGMTAPVPPPLVTPDGGRDATAAHNPSDGNS